MTIYVDINCEACGRSFSSHTKEQHDGSEYQGGRDTPYDAPTEIYCDFCRGEARCEQDCSRRATITIERGNYCTTHAIKNLINAGGWPEGAIHFPTMWEPSGRARTDIAPGEVVEFRDVLRDGMVKA